MSRPEDLPAGGGGRWPRSAGGFRTVRWGDLEVGYTTAGTLDCTLVCADLPGGVCPCPHWGYVLSGRFRATYPGSDLPDETATAGELYYFTAGHVLVYEEASEVLEFNPPEQLAVMMDHIEALATGTQ